jgi:hypothetical protein
MAIVCFVLVALGVLMILAGVFMSLADWKDKRKGEVVTEGLGDTLQGLAKVFDAIKDYPLGQKLIVFGIIVLVLAGVFGGISQF